MMFNCFEDFDYWLQLVNTTEIIKKAQIKTVKEYLVSEIAFVSRMSKAYVESLPDEEIQLHVYKLDNIHVSNLYMVYCTMNNEIAAYELQKKSIQTLIDHW